MPSKVDPAIIKALSIDVATATINTHGGSGFASTHRIDTPDTSIFVKTSSSAGAKVMFEGEHTSLNAINNVVPSFCPRSLAWGQLESSSGYFLATEFLDLGGRSSKNRGNGSGSGSGMNLAQKLAKLHSTPAPIPDGYDKSQYGFPVTTCCGETPQVNDYKSNWAEFFAENRMLTILEQAEKNNGSDHELRDVVQKVVDKVVPRLLSTGHLGGSQGIVPVVVHGDLWSGNKGKGSIISSSFSSSSKDENNSSIEDVVFDPSSSYAHSEYDHGIMNMFGGFGSSSFWNEYFSIVPKTEPVDEYEDRVRLYESYHHLNHYAMFGGGGYKGGALGLLKPLVKKYG